MRELLVRWWPSSKYQLSGPPHLRDPYEAQLVQVCPSSITGSGEVTSPGQPRQFDLLLGYCRV